MSLTPTCFLVIPVLLSTMLASGSNPPHSRFEPSYPVATPSPAASALAAPVVSETRTYSIRQTVTLREVPEGAKEVRVWVPIPVDAAWQHVLDRRVVEAPAGWRLERQARAGADMVVVATSRPAGAAATVQVVVETLVARESPRIDLGTLAPVEPQAHLFAEELRQDAPLMSADATVAAWAKKAVGEETDPARKVVRLLDAVADSADHYSKDPTKPHCGRGAAQDCIANGGGCCTDLHSLFVAAARSQGIPARIQFGYRLNAAKEGVEYDPSYRCWVEYFLVGAGWVPTDIVVADAGDRAARAAQYGTLDARRVALWQGRSLVLEPRQRGEAIETMICAWAEIDGEPVDVLPAADGTPSKLTRTIRFEDHTPGPKAPAAK